MTPPLDRRQKRETLRRHGTLHPRPEAVTHPLFQDHEFFDPDDLLQVKYEMLRQVQIEKNSISDSARAFGFSRPSFYQAQLVFQREGIFGLLPRKRGPQRGNKLTDEVMEFIGQQRSEDPSLSPEQLAQAVQKRFQVQVHPRSIERRLQREKKTALKLTITNNFEALRTAYEDLRAQILAGRRGPGLALFLRQGMREWLEVCGSTTVMATIKPVETTTSSQMVPPDMRSEIVWILAGLFLQKRGEANQ